MQRKPQSSLSCDGKFKGFNLTTVYYNTYLTTLESPSKNLLTENFNISTIAYF